MPEDLLGLPPCGAAGAPLQRLALRAVRFLPAGAPVLLGLGTAVAVTV